MMIEYTASVQMDIFVDENVELLRKFADCMIVYKLTSPFILLVDKEAVVEYNYQDTKGRSPSLTSYTASLLHYMYLCLEALMWTLVMYPTK